jgi:ribosomal protein S18 acetylase RimI-like enzyme
LYCDYYIEQEPENCFVLADAQDNAVGYILISENRQRYIADYARYYEPKLRAYRYRYVLLKKLENALQKQHVAAYPAHLHIDILPPYQGKGYGRKLMDAAAAHLRKKQVEGVMLGVAAANKNGIRFYERCGFQKLRQIPGTVFYGLKL